MLGNRTGNTQPRASVRPQAPAISITAITGAMNHCIVHYQIRQSSGQPAVRQERAVMLMELDAAPMHESVEMAELSW